MWLRRTQEAMEGTCLRKASPRLALRGLSKEPEGDKEGPKHWGERGVETELKRQSASWETGRGHMTQGRGEQ